MIISLLNQKGGVGKTTLAIHLAAALTKKKARTLLVDADPQGSALDWSAASDESSFTVIGLPKKTLHRELAAMSDDYDHIVIDGPPRVYDVARSAIVASDIVLVPTQPSPLDVWATGKEIVGMLDDISAIKEIQKSAFVINRKIVNTAIGRDVVAALEEFEIPVLKSHICQRVAFAECMAQGLTVLDIEPKGMASKEVNNFVQEVMNLR